MVLLSFICLSAIRSSLCLMKGKCVICDGVCDQTFWKPDPSAVCFQARPWFVMPENVYIEVKIFFLYSVLWPVRSLWSHMWSWIFQENPTQLSSTFSRWWGNCLNVCFLLLVLGQLSAQLTKSFSTSFTRLPCIEALDSPFAAFVFHLYCLKREVWAVVTQGCHGRGKTTK